tara:strand:+ start:703 stop:1296 length:594 start_codon:yes stop_codon:yes gene_type:complete
VVRNEEGDEAFSGPICARRRTDNPDEPIPDITAALLMPDAERREVPPGGGARQGGRREPNPQDDTHQLVSYLLLRCEKLIHYQDMENRKLSDVYDRYLTREILVEDDKPYVRNLLGLMERSRPELSLRNLRQVYACEFWVLRFIDMQEDEDGVEFGRGLLRYLRARLRLTRGQVDGLNKWLDNMPGMGLINPNGFYR